MNRVSRVAHRLGVVLAVPIFIAAIGAGAFGAYIYVVSDPTPRRDLDVNFMLVSGLGLAMLGVGVYGATRAAGWIINGWRDGT